MNRARSRFLIPAIAIGLFVSMAAVPQTQKEVALLQARLAGEVRAALILLPNYGIFDNLEFKISGLDTVTLLGQATRPYLELVTQLYYSVPRFPRHVFAIQRVV